jgi:hypothetical protein
MGFFEKILKKIRTYFFNKELKKVPRLGKKALGFDRAKKVGILYDCSQEKHYRQVVNLVRDLEKQGKSVHALGFLRQNKMPEYSFAQLNFSFCSRTDFSFALKLKNPQLQNFSRSGFDLLIDLTPHDLFFMKFLTGLTQATFKAGPYNDDYIEVYDIMIHEKENAQLPELISHMLHYLKIINPVNNEK